MVRLAWLSALQLGLMTGALAAGEILPLPRLEVPQAASPHVFRGVRQRVGRRNFVIDQANRCVDALNWLGKVNSASAGRPRSKAQTSALDHVLLAAKDATSRPSFCSRDEAVHALFKHRAGYEISTSGAVVLLSLPSISGSSRCRTRLRVLRVWPPFFLIAHVISSKASPMKC
jgi:hypothetical protein